MEKSLLHCFDQHELASGVQNQYKELPERTPQKSCPAALRPQLLHICSCSLSF